MTITILGVWPLFNLIQINLISVETDLGSDRFSPEMTIGILENLFSFFELRSIRLTGWGILRKIQWNPHIKWFKTSDSISSFFYGNLNSSIYIIYISYINSYTIIHIHFFPQVMVYISEIYFSLQGDCSNVGEKCVLAKKPVCWCKTFTDMLQVTCSS